MAVAMVRSVSSPTSALSILSNLGVPPELLVLLILPMMIAVMVLTMVTARLVVAIRVASMTQSVPALDDRPLAYLIVQHAPDEGRDLAIPIALDLVPVTGVAAVVPTDLSAHVCSALLLALSG